MEEKLIEYFNSKLDSDAWSMYQLEDEGNVIINNKNNITVFQLGQYGTEVKINNLLIYFIFQEFFTADYNKSKATDIIYAAVKKWMSSLVRRRVKSATNIKYSDSYADWIKEKGVKVERKSLNSLEKNVLSYLDVHLKKMWTIYKTNNRNHWMIDQDDKQWVVILETNNSLSINQVIVREINDIFSIGNRTTSFIITKWIEDLFKIKVGEVLVESFSFKNIVDNMISNGEVVSLNEDVEGDWAYRKYKDILKYLDILMKNEWVSFESTLEPDSTFILNPDEEKWVLEFRNSNKLLLINNRATRDLRGLFDITETTCELIIKQWFELKRNIKIRNSATLTYGVSTDHKIFAEYSDINKQKINKLTEQVEEFSSPTLKYYAFDWDDNIVTMPTRIMLMTDKGKEIGIDTKDYAKYKDLIGKEDFEYKNEVIKGFAENPFRNFRTEGDKNFLIDAMLAVPGPSWTDFVETINNGSVFAIITARGHSPETIKEAVYNYIISNFNGIDKSELVKNLKKYRNLSGDKDLSDANLIREYLKLCKFYPVSFGQEDNPNPEVAKVEALKEFSTHVKRLASKLNKKIYLKNNIKNYFVPIIGFSDDDRTNIESVKKHFKDKPELKTFYTGNGSKEKY